MKTLVFSTKGKIEFIDISDEVQDAAASSGIRNGLVHVFAPHATGILLLTENEPSLLNDIRRLLNSVVPEDANYDHPANAYAHLRSVLFPPDRSLPLVERKVQFGTWQSLLFVETDAYPRKRTVLIQVMGES